MIGYVEKAYKYLLLTPAILPLVYLDGFLYPYVAPKTLLFRTIFIVAVAAFAYLALSGRPFYFERLKSWISWLPGMLVLVAYATSFIGIDFYHSFWSIFDRGDGLLTLTAAVGLFYLILLYADREFLRKLLSYAAWTGSLVALYAILQWLQGVSGLNIPLITEPLGRLGATFGNAAFLAAYLGMTLFAALAVRKEYGGKWQRALYGGIALQLLAIILAATRGTILALFTAGIVAALYVAWNGSGSMRTYARNGLIGTLVLAALFFGFREQLAHAPFEPVRRIASISVEDATVSSRLFVWENMFNEAMKQPLTGYGAEHVDVLFNRVYDPAAILEEWFDRSHNAYLDYFVQYGILGVLVYLLIIGSLARAATRAWQKEDQYSFYILGMVFVYAIQNFFVFDTAMTLWLLLAVFAAMSARVNDVQPSRFYVALPHIPAVAIGVALLILLYPVSFQPLRANLLLAQGYLYHIADVDRANEGMRKGLSLGTYADLEYGFQAYEMYTERQQIMLQGQERVAAYRYTLETLMKNYERYSYDARTATYLAHVLDSVPPEESVDEEFLRQVLARAMELSPKRAQAQYILANISLKKGDKAAQTSVRNQHYREAISILEAYAEEVPNLAEPRYIIAGLYFVMGDRVTAKTWADEGLALYENNGGSGVPMRAAKYYINTEDWPNAIYFLEKVLGESPNDYEQLYDLAKLYFLNGNRERALQIYERIKREKPGLVETDPAFVRAIEG